MIYLGPLSGRGGSGTPIDVPAHGQTTVGHGRACPRARPECFVVRYTRKLGSNNAAICGI